MNVGDKVVTTEPIPFGCFGRIVHLPAGRRGVIIGERDDWLTVKLNRKFDCIESFQTTKEFSRLRKVM